MTRNYIISEDELRREREYFYDIDRARLDAASRSNDSI